ncbi:glycosyltransferase involved in cell wall biosynthesis [Paenibacillus taihuensis]|uniref:Glycosyltransferase involved in cell wall biosynthesis n=1 Tax=Paenibacillus taihuensis TaxID=1156355 RepID=A0A3D9SE65_9BACL|nr:glycosyltransferase family 2 protein [Paenibacillus taihuensis]REE93149.1 glycosyltransferase involved in cell wall biosynthesis [Paenibacillus taihuensis]
MTFHRVPQLASVVIGAYNSARHIEEALESLIHQTYPHIEIIVVNDGSTDATDIVVKKWMEKRRNHPVIKDNRFVYHVLPHNIGYSGAYTTGYFLARGEFIATHAADDVSHPQRIEKQVAFLQNNLNFCLCGTALAWFNDGSFDSPYHAEFIKFGYQTIAGEYMSGGHCVCHGTLMMRGTLFDLLGGLERYPRGKMTVAEDYYFIRRYVLQGYSVDNLPEVLYYYRRYPEQRSQNGSV